MNLVMFAETIDSWKERLPELVEGYAKDDTKNVFGTWTRQACLAGSTRSWIRKQRKVMQGMQKEQTKGDDCFLRYYCWQEGKTDLCMLSVSIRQISSVSQLFQPEQSIDDWRNYGRSAFKVESPTIK